MCSSHKHATVLVTEKDWAPLVTWLGGKGFAWYFFQGCGNRVWKNRTRALLARGLLQIISISELQCYLSSLRNISARWGALLTYMAESFPSFTALFLPLVKLKKHPHFHTSHGNCGYSLFHFFTEQALSLLHLDISKIKLAKYFFHNALGRKIRHVFKCRWRMTAKS